jgi:hypothetical protein
MGSRQRWAVSLLKHFGVDPLIDDFGHRMQCGGIRKLFKYPGYSLTRNESETFSELGPLLSESDDNSANAQACVRVTQRLYLL